jgi:hypothetical protein
MARVPLSLNWTQLRIRGLLRILANELAGTEISDDTIDDISYLATSGVVSQLGEAVENDYIEIATVTQTSNVIDVSTLAIAKIVKLVDATNGLVPEKGAKQFEGIKVIDQEKNRVFFTRRGNNLDIFKGSGISTYGILTLHYKTRPIKPASSTVKLDISDDYIDIVVAKAKIMVYEIVAKTVPQSLQDTYSGLIDKVRNANAGEQAQASKQ